MVVRGGRWGDPAFDQDDAEQEAAIGLLEAARRFDSGRGVMFTTAARPRVKGQVADARRRLDPVPRRVRRYEQAKRAAMARLNRALGRAPTRAELREGAGLTEEQDDELTRLLLEVWSLDAFRLFRTESADNFQAPLHDRLPDEHDEAERRQLEARMVLERALDTLEPRDQFVLRCRFFLDMTHSEVGGLMGVTESRVNQIQTRALDRLRDEL